jgi:hypothetical protein
MPLSFNELVLLPVQGRESRRGRSFEKSLIDNGSWLHARKALHLSIPWSMVTDYPSKNGKPYILSGESYMHPLAMTSFSRSESWSGRFG